MRILMHCIYFPPEVGGLESHVYHLGRGLARRGHEVTVVTSRSRSESPVRESLEGIEVFRTWFPSRSSAGWITHSLASIPLFRRLARGFDVLHAQAFASVPAGILGRSASGAPLVATFHTSHFLVRARKRRWRPLLKRLVAAPDHCFAASREIAEVAEGLAPGRSVEALTNGVDTERFRPVAPTLSRDRGEGRGGEAPFRIVVPRRLFPKNGVEYLIRAVPILVKQAPRPVQALLIGDGPERPRLEALARDLGVEREVRFLGARPNEEMPGLLSSGDLVVVPSLMEATSVAALEAMACGLPVAASRVGGLPEIVDEEVGTLFTPGDPADLARAVVELLAAGDLAERGAAARRRVVERWSNERLVDRHLEVYEALIGRGERA